MTKTFTVEQISKYIMSKDNMWDVLYYLSEKNIEKAQVGESCRVYDRLVEDDDQLMTIKKWFESKDVSLGNYDGIGYWVKDGFRCHDEVFSSEPEDATHVVWFNFTNDKVRLHYSVT